MGYFAVLKSSDTDQFTIGRCHLNVWVVSGLVPGRHLLYFDVGVEVQASGSNPVSSFQLLLPFRVEVGMARDAFITCQDLFPNIVEQSTAELIFGGPVSVTTAGPNGRDYQLTSTTAPPLTVARMDVTRAKAVDDFKEDDDCSLYELYPQAPVAAGEAKYFRMRFRVFQTEPLWNPKHYLGGVVVDLRMCDVRESRHVDHEAQLRPRIVEIQRSDIFLMAPENYQLAHCSPETKYIRVLEPYAWRAYLAGAAFRPGPTRYLVYSWRSRADARGNDVPIDQDAPYRVFADFNRSRFSSTWSSIIGIILAAALLLGCVKLGQFCLSEYRAHHIRVTALLTIFGLTTLAGVTGLLKRVVNWAVTRAIGPRRYIRFAERMGLQTMLTWSKK